MFKSRAAASRSLYIAIANVSKSTRYRSLGELNEYVYFVNFLSCLQPSSYSRRAGRNVGHRGRDDLNDRTVPCIARPNTLHI